MERVVSECDVFLSDGHPDGPGYLPADRAARLDVRRTISPLGLPGPSARTVSTT